MKRARLIFMLLPLGFSVLGSHAAAASTSLNQQILPLNCVFQTIDSGTGTLYYVTPEACGVFINPSPSVLGSSTPLSAPTTPVYGTAVTSPTAASGTIDLGQLLNLPVNSDSPPPVTFTASVGQIYSFAIATSAEHHTLTVDHVNLSNPSKPTVTLILHSKPVTITLSQGQTKLEDLTGDGKPNIGITANSITASDVNLTVWQIVPHKTPSGRFDSLSQQRPQILWLILATITVLFVYFFSKKTR